MFIFVFIVITLDGESEKILLCFISESVWPMFSPKSFWVFSFLFILFFCLFDFSRATPVAYGGSQARGRIGSVAASLRQSHGNARSEPCL